MTSFTSSRGYDSPRQYTLLVAGAEQARRSFLAAQLDADGHTVYEAHHAAAVIAKLSCYAIDVLVLAELERPYEAPALLRSLRAGEHERVHPNLPVITLGAGDELNALRAYEHGSDHHLPTTTGYVLLRAVLATVARRMLQDTGARHLHAGDIHVDLAARTVCVNDTPAHLGRLEFELLIAFASDPIRVFSKHQLARHLGRQHTICDRTVDSHVCRLRSRLIAAGAHDVLINKRGQGWALTTITPPSR